MTFQIDDVKPRCPFCFQQITDAVAMETYSQLVESQNQRRALSKAIPQLKGDGHTVFGSDPHPESLTRTIAKVLVLHGTRRRRRKKA